MNERAIGVYVRQAHQSLLPSESDNCVPLEEEGQQMVFVSSIHFKNVMTVELNARTRTAIDQLVTRGPVLLVVHHW